VLEAFAAGVPVLASDLGGLAEIVQHEGNGLRFAAGDATALRTALERLARDPALFARLVPTAPASIATTCPAFAALWRGD
jgi:1,4-alpha-glucan branching enzyme